MNYIQEINAFYYIQTGKEGVTGKRYIKFSSQGASKAVIYEMISLASFSKEAISDNS